MATYVSDSGPLDDYFRGACPFLGMTSTSRAEIDSLIMWL